MVRVVRRCVLVLVLAPVSEVHDEANDETPDINGDRIAREIQRFLRQRGNDE